MPRTHHDRGLGVVTKFVRVHEKHVGRFIYPQKDLPLPRNYPTMAELDSESSLPLSLFFTNTHQNCINTSSTHVRKKRLVTFLPIYYLSTDTRSMSHLALWQRNKTNDSRTGLLIWIIDREESTCWE
jgi:hypothetical protein